MSKCAMQHCIGVIDVYDLRKEGTAGLTLAEMFLNFRFFFFLVFLKNNTLWPLGIN